MVLFLCLGLSSWGQTETITITQVSAGIDQGDYNSGAERTWTQDEVGFGAKAVMKQSGQDRIQFQANNGVIYNTSPLPGKIVSISIDQTASNVFNFFGGNTTRLVNNTSANYTVTGGTQVGSSSSTGWNASNFNETNYTFFAIKKGSGVSYVSSITIEYEVATSCEASNIAFTDTTVNKDLLDPSFTQTATSLNATTAITYESSDELVATVNATTGEVALVGIGTATITATQEAGEHSGIDYCAGTATYDVVVTSSEPVLTVSTNSASFTGFAGGAAATEDITVEGFNLTGNITLALSGDANFSINPTSLSSTGGAVTITYTPSATPATHSATLTVSNGSLSEEITLSGVTNEMPEEYAGVGTFEKITSTDDLTDGYYVVAYNEFAMTNDGSGGAYLAEQDITSMLTDDIVTNPSVDLVWKIETNSEGTTLFNENIEKYISKGSGNTNLDLVDNVITDNQRYTVSFTNDFFKFESKAVSGRSIGYNTGAPRFAFYTGSSQQPVTITLYKLQGPATQVATPTITATGVENGVDTYFNTANITLETTTDGATIYYTTDGSEPTTASTAYTIAFDVTETTTIKAFATADGLDDSTVAEKEITITNPATADIPHEEAFNNTLGDWISYTNAGVNWTPSANGAFIDGYPNQSELVWLISPKLLSVGVNGLLLSFDHESEFTGNDLEIRYSTDYAGYGDPTTATWTTASTVEYVESGSVTNLAISVSGDVHIALVYTDIIFDSHGDWTISNLSIDTPSTDPVIAVNPTTVDFVTEAGILISQVVTVTANNLTEGIAVSGDTVPFSVTPTSLGIEGGDITITYEPTTVGTHMSSITLSSAGANDITIPLNGTASLGSVTATAATNVASNSFTANWDAVAGAESYEIDAYTVEETIGGFATDLFISEYVEGTSNNKYIEIYNGTGTTVDLSNYKVVLHANGSTASTNTQVLGSLQASLEHGEIIILKNGSASLDLPAGIIAYTSSVCNFNGDDAIGLYKNDILLDSFGNIGTQSDYGTNITLRRDSTIFSPNIIYTENEWASFPVDTVDNLGSHTFEGGTSIDIVYHLENENVGNVTSYEVIGLDPETTYYYVVRAVAGAETSANSNEIEVTTTATSTAVTWTTSDEWSNVIGPTLADDVIIEGVLVVNSLNNFDAKSLTVNGSITIQNEGVVKVQGAVVNNGGFTVEAGGNLIQVDDVENTGAITVKVEAQTEYFGFNMFSSPVAGQTFEDFSSGNGGEVFEYGYNGDETGNWEDASGYNFAEGYGYLFAAPYVGFPQGELTTFYGEFTGVPNNGDVTVAANNEFVSLGNPYPSAIDAVDFLTTNTNVNALYFWTNANLYDYDFDNPGDAQGWVANNYVVYNTTGHTNTSGNGGNFNASNVIMTGQGFIAATTANGDVSFDNDMRFSDYSSGTFYKVMEEDKHRLWLNLEDQNNVKNQILIGYMEGASHGVDARFDAKMFGYDGSALYSLIDNSEANYAIQGRYPFTNADIVPLGFRAIEGGTYTISLANFDGLFAEGQDIFLKDNLTESLIDLKEEDYTFVSEPGVFDARFEIVYNATMSVNNPTLDNNWVVYKQNGSFQIVSQGFEMSQVTVFDMLGRTIYQSEAINGTSHQLPEMGANGVLIIRITSADQGVSTKKVIN